MESAEVPQRVKPKIVNDQFKEIRQELRQRAHELQKYVHFEATAKPHLDKLAKDIDALVKKCDEHEADIRELEEATKKEKEKRKSVGQSSLTDDERMAKIQKITELEEKYQRLLEEKAFYLAKYAEDE